MSQCNQEELAAICRKARRLIVEMIYRAGSGHVGGSLSTVEILAALYYRVLKVDPKQPRWSERDRFILSKGHAGPALYAILALKGYFPESELFTMNQGNTILPSHVDMNRTPGVDMTTGALGQGLSCGVGMAFAARMDRKTHRIWVMLGDGETNEGQNWEAAMCAAKYRLDNLTVIIDHNHLQSNGPAGPMVGSLADKWTSFGWEVWQTDGHDLAATIATLEQAARTAGKPTAIIAHTIKGKGLPFAENLAESHNMKLNPEQFEQAMNGLNA
jgi:transketolase